MINRRALRIAAPRLQIYGFVLLAGAVPAVTLLYKRSWQESQQVVLCFSMAFALASCCVGYIIGSTLRARGVRRWPVVAYVSGLALPPLAYTLGHAVGVIVGAVIPPIALLALGKYLARSEQAQSRSYPACRAARGKRR